MLGFKSRDSEIKRNASNTDGDVAKLLFDTFSRRISQVEETLQGVRVESEKLRLSLEQGQISDLVLLERLQRAEGMIRESLVSIKTAVEQAFQTTRLPSPAHRAEVKPTGSLPLVEPETGVEARIASRVLSPTGELGSLPSITTATELQVLTLLAREGPKSAPEIGRVVGRSREHTARLMKKLFEEGFIRRDQTRIPFRYSVVERLRQPVKGESKDEEKEAVSVPQS